MVADRLVMLSDLDTNIIQIAVDTVGFEAFAFGSSALHFPQRGGGLNLAPNRAIVPLPMPGITGQEIAKESLMQDIAKQTR